MSYKIILILSISFLGIRESSSSGSLDNGFGKDINWVNFHESISTANQLSKVHNSKLNSKLWAIYRDILITSNYFKPIFLIVHKIGCGASESLKQYLASSEEFRKLSKHFVMVNVEDGDKTRDKDIPDYVPRVLFVNSLGYFEPELFNDSGNPDFKYFYYNDKQVVKSMKNAIRNASSLSHSKDNAGVDQIQHEKEKWFKKKIKYEM